MSTASGCFSGACSREELEQAEDKALKLCRNVVSTMPSSLSIPESTSTDKTGSETSHDANLYARLHSGSDVWEHVNAWFATYPTGNLWNTDNGSGFQIDGNWGFTSGITEMLLQSHAGSVHILPALPEEAIPTGSAKGLLARGGFEVDIEWEEGVFKAAVVTSKLGGELSLRVQDGCGFSVNDEPYNDPIPTTKGEKYEIKAEGSGC